MVNGRWKSANRQLSTANPLKRMTKTLTKAEEQVMQVLWKLGKGFLKEIIESTPDPKPHSNTIATILKILVEKGFVEYSVHGRNNLYRTLISQADYGKKSVNQLIKGYFDGSHARLVSQFITDRKLTEAELETLLQQIQLAKNSKP
jgi:BlaI family transcriptional regulator, penicillinase repressor